MSTLMQNAAERILNRVDSSENEFTNDLKSFEEIANEAEGLTVTPSGIATGLLPILDILLEF